MPPGLADFLTPYIDALRDFAPWYPTAGALTLAAVTTYALARVRLAGRDIKTLAQAINRQTEIIQELQARLNGGGAPRDISQPAAELIGASIGDHENRIAAAERWIEGRDAARREYEAGETDALHSTRRAQAQDRACRGR